MLTCKIGWMRAIGPGRILMQKSNNIKPSVKIMKITDLNMKEDALKNNARTRDKYNFMKKTEGSMKEQ